MSTLILNWAFFYAQAALGLAILMATWRIGTGPRAQDRVLAMDTLYVNAMLLILILGMRNASMFFFEATLVIAILGFTATVTLAKFLMRGEVVE